ncbi:MAG: hypothetical protein VX670_11345, partial [Candidatus Latescibacterota bacterium]|nr:hypothetical protein [Candidatus Latescibacterota bacterium]
TQMSPAMRRRTQASRQKAPDKARRAARGDDAPGARGPQRSAYATGPGDEDEELAAEAEAQRERKVLTRTLVVTGGECGGPCRLRCCCMRLGRRRGW